MGPAVNSKNDPNGAHFEISINGVVRTHRDAREAAIDAARLLAARNAGARIAVRDLRDGSPVPFERT